MTFDLIKTQKSKQLVDCCTVEVIEYDGKFENLGIYTKNYTILLDRKEVVALKDFLMNELLI